MQAIAGLIIGAIIGAIATMGAGCIYCTLRRSMILGGN